MILCSTIPYSSGGNHVSSSLSHKTTLPSFKKKYSFSNDYEPQNFI